MEPIDFMNWRGGEPNNIGNQDCMVVTSGGRWDDEECTKLFTFIVEYECDKGFEFGPTRCEGASRSSIDLVQS